MVASTPCRVPGSWPLQEQFQEIGGKRTNQRAWIRRLPGCACVDSRVCRPSRPRTSHCRRLHGESTHPIQAHLALPWWVPGPSPGSPKPTEESTATLPGRDRGSAIGAAKFSGSRLNGHSRWHGIDIRRNLLRSPHSTRSGSGCIGDESRRPRGWINIASRLTNMRGGVRARGY